MPSARAPRLIGYALVLAIGAMIAWRLMPGRAQVESLVPVVVDSRRPLILELDSAAQEEGFPPHARFLEPLLYPTETGATANVDSELIPFVMPTNGRVAFAPMELHESASLRFGYGIEQVNAKEAEGASVEFRVKARTASGGEVVLWKQSATAGKAGSAPQRTAARIELPQALTGPSATLVFETRCTSTLPELALCPAFASPVLESAGVKKRVEDLARPVETASIDLLARFPQVADEMPHVVVSHDSPERVFAVLTGADGKSIELESVERERTAAFETAKRHEAERWGSEPAIAFGLDGDVVAYDVDVPAKGETALEFDIGVDERCIGVGAATFVVRVGDETVFDETLDPGSHAVQAGWQPRTIDLTAHAGKRIHLVLAGEIAVDGAPRTLDLVEPKPLGQGHAYRLEVRRVRGAFGRPRVVTREPVKRRLAAKYGPARPSVIVVNVETLRADALGCYGGREGISPAIDRLAGDGIRIDPCISVAPWTSPSVASLFTGLYPYGHGVISYAQSDLADGLDTLAEVAARDGVTTAAFVTNADLLSRRKNFAQGFETYAMLRYANARQVVGVFEDWLQDHKDLQFLAYLHLFEPHDPCDAPGEDFDRYVDDDLKGADSRARLDELKGRLLKGEAIAPGDPAIRLLRGRYLGEVRYLDRQIERLRQAVERAGLIGKVVIVLTSDHGEEFVEHGAVGHGSQCFEETLRVPLIAFGPGLLPQGKVLAGPVENAALYATVLELLGAPYDRTAVKPAIDFTQDKSGGTAYSSTEQGIRRIAPPDLFTKTIHRLRTRNQALRVSPREDERADQGAPEPLVVELFDLDSDPLEQHPRVPQGQELAEWRKRIEDAYQFATRQRFGLGQAEIDDATQRALGALGYAAGSATNPPGRLFDP